MPDELIRMKHPDIEVPSGETTRRAFEEIYKGQGWVEISIEDADKLQARFDAKSAPKEAASEAKGGRS